MYLHRKWTGDVRTWVAIKPCLW